MRRLQNREANLLVGVVSSLAIWWVWAAVTPLPLIEDEYSYVLQSRIFATGHWAVPAVPAAIQDFFQQAHVLASPAIASKFPPGHALLLSIGSWLGDPALIPLVLTGITGALIFWLARRISSAWVGLLTWIIWLGDPINLRFRAAYYSEVTSGAMWIVSLWALLEWRETRRTRWLLLLAAAIGWGAITRPLTMLAFAVPVGAVVIRDVLRVKLWRDFGLAFALGCTLLGIIPLWSAKTTGDWRLTPHALYNRDFLPYDKLGFGVDATPPAKALMPVNLYTYIGFFGVHKFHTIRNLPKTAFDRLRQLAHDEWTGPRLALVPFVLVGLMSLGAPLAFALMCSLALFLGYLTYGHWAEWTIYYFEALPPLSLLAALGVRRVIVWIRSRARRLPAPLRRETAYLYAATVLLALLTLNELEIWHAQRNRMAAWDLSFHDTVDHLQTREAILFVHYAPRIGPHSLVVGVSPRVMHDSMWIVNDLGPRDTVLMHYAGRRVPLLFHEDGGKVEIDQLLLTPR